MEKFNNSSGVEAYSCEPPNVELTFFAGLQPTKFAKLIEQELTQLVEVMHWALGE